MRNLSPAIDAGDSNVSNPGLPTTDRDGNQRIFGAAVDMGAYEASLVQVIAINRLDPTPSNAASLRFQVLFDKPVIGVDQSDFALVSSGTLSDMTISSISGSGTTWIVTLATGSGDGILQLELNDDDTIHDMLDNPLGGIGVGNGNFMSGQIYTLDRSSPTAALLSVTDISSGETNQTFSVEYRDNLSVQRASLGDNNLLVIGPNGFVQFASLIEVGSESDETLYRTTYRINAPGGHWSMKDNGMYNIELVPNTITDGLGNPMSAKRLGSFTVNISASQNKQTNVYLPWVISKDPPNT